MVLTSGYYHPNLCLVCRASAWDIELKRCKQCHLVSYCGPKHQKMHWKTHKRVCSVVPDAFRDLEKIKNENTISRGEFRTLLLNIVQEKIGDKATSEEYMMLFWFKACLTCDTTQNLTDCEECLSKSFCINHSSAITDHRSSDDCKNLKLLLNINLNKGSHDFTTSKQIDHDFKDIKTFVQKNVRVSSKLCETTRALAAHAFTRPLTVLYALSILKTSWSVPLQLHIVGSHAFETSYAQVWNILLQVRPIPHLKLDFIGPESTPTSLKTGLITASSTTELYHEWMEGATRESPSAICAFNCGIEEDAPDWLTTWAPSIEVMLALRVPIVLTSYTLHEAVKNVKPFLDARPGLRVRQIANPFVDLIPNRDPESFGLFFDNSVLSIIEHS